MEKEPLFVGRAVGKTSFALSKLQRGKTSVILSYAELPLLLASVLAEFLIHGL